MNAVLNSTEVRSSWGRFIDTVTHDRPQFVKRNRDTFAAISVGQLRAILSAYTFTAEITEEEDGSFTGSLNEISDIIGFGLTREELKKELAQNLIEYANEYIEEYQLYSKAPNRKSHSPYILHVLVKEDLDEVINLIHA
jgi:predicted RNase H-like HicB family nuclease